MPLFLKRRRGRTPRRVRKDLASRPLTELRQRARKINPDDVRKMFLNTAYAGQTIDTILEEARAGPPARGMPLPRHPFSAQSC